VGIISAADVIRGKNNKGGREKDGNVEKKMKKGERKGRKGKEKEKIGRKRIK
jgi:hypothetical protein